MQLGSLMRFSVPALLAVLATTLSGCGTRGDAVHGKQLYVQCQVCHRLTENFVGPMHCGLIGRPAGSVPGFEYSEGMKASGVTWDPKSIDQFLTSPVAYVNGTKMGFAGFESPNDRADVIAYLKQANNDPALCPRK